MANKLTIKQSLFIKEYLVDLHATNAAKRAGYSEKTAYSQGQRLLKNVEISDAIEAAVKKRADKIEVNADWVLKEAVNLYNSCVDAEDRNVAGATLKTIGNHVNIQAFNEKRTLDLGEDTLKVMLGQVDGKSKGPPSER